MDETGRLVEALRLAVDPAGGVSVEALRDLVREDDGASWDIATVARHVGVSPHTLRYYERLDLLMEHRDALRAQIAQLQLALAATEYKIATYGGATQP